MNQSTVLAQRLGVFGQTDALLFLRQSIPIIIDWVGDLAVDSLPDRETTLKWVEDAIQKVLESTDFPVVDDKLIDPIVLNALMTLAGKVYDSIANKGPVV